MVFSWELTIEGVNIEDYGNIRSSYNTNGLGTSGCCSAQLEFDIYDETGRICDSISRFAKVKLSGSGFISQDFFVTARTSANHVCHCVCYDRICMLDKPFYCDINWEETEDVDGQYVYEQIAEQCGFDGVGGISGFLPSFKYTEADLTGKTCRNLLDEITAALCGTTFCDGTDGSILSISCTGDDTAYSGSISATERTELDYRGKTVITGLNMSNNSTGDLFFYGNDYGYVIDIESRFVTEALAEAVWGNINGYVYRAWNCEKALCGSAPGTLGAVVLEPENEGESLPQRLIATSVNFSFDSTGIYFSGGAEPFNDWQYRTRVERTKIGVSESVGDMVIQPNGRIEAVPKFVNENK